MAQTFTSASTSINSTRLPAVYRTAPLNHRYVIDYGCGKYVAHIREAVAPRAYFPYDPFNQPADVNDATMTFIRVAMQEHIPLDIVCSNVLNVIDSDTVVTDIAKQICDIVETTGGTAYITVYEGNRSGVGRQTGADQYQRNAPHHQYLRFFRNAKIYRGMIVVG